MGRLSPKSETLRALFARSGNQCAFPGCYQALISESNKFIGQVCHIEAAEPKGQRYNPLQTDEERRSYENIILLCYPHHIESNDVSIYSVTKLKKIKNDHESIYEKNPYKIDESALYKIISEMDEYWATIERINRYEHICEEAAIPINAKGSFFEIISEIKEKLSTLELQCSELRTAYLKNIEEIKTCLLAKQIPLSLFDDNIKGENTFEDGQWENYNLIISNLFIYLETNLTHIELKYLEEYLKTNSNDLGAKELFEQLKLEFKDIAQNNGYSI